MTPQGLQRRLRGVFRDIFMTAFLMSGRILFLTCQPSYAILMSKQKISGEQSRKAVFRV